MNATKFVVLLMIGVVFSNVVDARQLEGVSRDTKVDISIPKITTTNGLGVQLTVTAGTYSYSQSQGTGEAAASPSGPSAIGSGGSYAETGGNVVADCPNARASSSSNAFTGATGSAEATPESAAGRGDGSGSAGSNTEGSCGSQ